MVSELSVILITGRTVKQGVGLVSGKNTQAYIEEVSTVEVSKADLQKMGLQKGDKVILRSKAGSIDAKCREAQIPEGLVFMPYGSWCNVLIDTETHGTGMPDSKGFTVTIEPFIDDRKIRT